MLSITPSSVTWNGQALQAVAGEYIVKSALPANQLMLQMQTAGLKPSSITNLGRGNIGSDTYLVVDKTTPAAAVNWWGQRAVNVVTAIGPNLVVRAFNLPNEFNGNNPNLWGLHNRGGLATVDANGNAGVGVAGADIGMGNAWDLGTGNRQNIVAVLDTGVDITHPDLAANIWRNSGDGVQDTVDNDGNGVVDDFAGANFTTVDANTGAILPDNVVDDVVGHGTHVAGIIGAVGNNNGVGSAVGVNWSVQIMAVKVLDDTGAGTSAMILAGLNYVQFMKQVKGFNIVAANLSLGGNFEGPLNGIGDPTGVAQIFVALQQLTNTGVVVTVAAGNEGSNNDVVPVFPASYVGSNFLSVASTNAADQLSSFSNFGTRVQIAAPGEDIYSTVPPGVDPSGYMINSGTSMASPMVAGAVAFLKSIAPGASTGQIVRAILDGADRLPQLEGVVVEGRRLNVFRSAEILLGNRPLVYNLEVFGGTTIAGWAFDPNLGTKAVTGVVIIDDSQQIPFSTTTNRPDVNKIFFTDGRASMPGTHGFNVNLTLTPGLHKVDVYLYDVNHYLGVITLPDGNYIATPRLVGSTFVEGNRPPIGNVDIVNGNQIAGWAWDPDSAGIPINVRIDVDGETVAVIPANEFHSPRVGTHGFFYTPNLAAGAHRVEVYALDDFTQGGTLIGTRTGVGNRALAHTSLSWDPVTRVLSGYVVDPDSAFDPVSVQIVIDGTDGGRMLLEDEANIDIPGMSGFIPQAGNTQHGFAIQIPHLAPANHEIRVYGIDRQTGEKTEMLYVPVVINQPPTGQFRTVNQDQIIGVMTDPNSPGAPMYYRLDIDGNIGHVAQATVSEGINVRFDRLMEQMSPGAHTATLWVLDAQSLQMVQAATQNFNVRELDQPRGTLDAPGVGLNTISGTADTAREPQEWDDEEVPAQVALVIYGWDPNFHGPDVRRDPVLILTTVANLNVGGGGGGNQGGENGWQFTRATIDAAMAAAGLTGLYFGQVFVLPPQELPEEPEDPEAELPPLPDPYLPEDVLDLLPTSTWLGEGQIARPNANFASGYFAQVDFVSLQGNATVAPNDEAPILAVDLNNAQFTIVDVSTLGLPSYTIGSAFTFNVPTPHLPQLFNNVTRMQYFDFITGQLRPMTTNGQILRNPKPIPTIPVNNFVNRRLIVTGNFLPAGSLDSVTGTKIAGWVRDADNPGVPLQYRVDIDDTIGMVMTASETRSDLPFLQPVNSGESITFDDDHGFSFDTPRLPAGTHLARLWAIDPNTKQETLIGQRSFTVIEEANRRPIGVVEVLTDNRIGGWAQDPTTPGWDMAIEVRVDGVVVDTQQASILRTDLPPRNGATVRGFDFAMPAGIAPGIHQVDVYAVDSSDATRKTLLKSGIVETGTHQIAGSFDLVDFFTIAGWARGAANDPAPTFRLDINNVWYQTFSGEISADPTEAAMGLRRFVYENRAVGSSSNNVVSLYYIDPYTLKAILVTQKVLGAIQPTFGSVDQITPTVIQGWALSASAPNAVIDVQILVDNVIVGTTAAGLARPDLTGALANHAFVFNMPQLAPGTHSVQVRFREPVTGDYSLVTSTTLLVTA